MRKISGIVIRGDRRGKKLGFPTANLKYRGRLHGVYAVYAYVNGKQYDGSANIGYAPTFNRKTKLLEVFIFGFRKNIYGKKIEVEIVRKVRDEKKFGSAEELVKEIRRDIRKAKMILNSGAQFQNRGFS